MARYISAISKTLDLNDGLWFEGVSGFCCSGRGCRRGSNPWEPLWPPFDISLAKTLAAWRETRKSTLDSWEMYILDRIQQPSGPQFERRV